MKRVREQGGIQTWGAVMEAYRGRQTKPMPQDARLSWNTKRLMQSLGTSVWANFSQCTPTGVHGCFCTSVCHLGQVGKGWDHGGLLQVGGPGMGIWGPPQNDQQGSNRVTGCGRRRIQASLLPVLYSTQSMENDGVDGGLTQSRRGPPNLLHQS